MMFLPSSDLSGLIYILYEIIVFSTLYITIYKFGYIVNVFIYIFLKSILPAILVSIFVKSIFNSVSYVFIGYAIFSLFIVFIVGKVRDWFEYETMIWYVLLMSLIESIFLIIFEALLKLF